MIENTILYVVISVVILTIVAFVALFSPLCVDEEPCEDYHMTISLGETVVKTFKDFKTREGYLPDGVKAVFKDEISGKHPEWFQSDSWGNLFVYKILENQNHFLLYSIGANGVDELGQGDDIVINPNHVNRIKNFYCD